MVLTTAYVRGWGKPRWWCPDCCFREPEVDYFDELHLEERLDELKFKEAQ